MKNSKYKAVLFDLDGTLLDTLQDLTTCMNKALISMGFPPHEKESIKYFIGNGREALALRSLPENHRDAGTLSTLVERLNTEYDVHGADTTAPYPGIPEMLNRLIEKEIKMVILSNKPHNYTVHAVSELLPGWHFEIVRGALPDVPVKPDPTAALQIARELGVPPSEFVYVGDSDIDMQTAVAAGMLPVGVLWGFRTDRELQAGGAKVLIQSPADLLKLF
jgi:phosphoglycolate phosphatase